MPKLEYGDIAAVADSAGHVTQKLKPYLDDGYDVIALVPSCALMLKFEWPLIVPDDGDIKRLAEATFDITEYVVDIARKEGLADGLSPIAGGVAVHLACHARAQSMGAKAADMLRLVPDTETKVIERCSGHGGAWGCRKEFFEVAMETGHPTALQALESECGCVTSECPLAGMHIIQGMERLADEGAAVPDQAPHPIELLARSYGL